MEYSNETVTVINSTIDDFSQGKINGYKLIYILEDIIGKDIDEENKSFLINGFRLTFRPLLYNKLQVTFGDRIVENQLL